MEKKVRKISLSTMLLIIALIVIIIMGYYIYKLSRVQEADKQIMEEIEGFVGENINGAVGKIENVKNTKTNIRSSFFFRRSFYWCSMYETLNKEMIVMKNNYFTFITIIFYNMTL